MKGLLCRFVAGTILGLVLLGGSCPVRAVGNHRATLVWQPVTSYSNSALPLSSNVCYIVYKSKDGTNFVPVISDLALSTTSWTDSNVLPNHTYWYYVTAYDSKYNTESAHSNAVSVVIP